MSPREARPGGPSIPGSSRWLPGAEASSAVLRRGLSPPRRPLREIQAVQRRPLPVDGNLVGRPAVVVGVAAVDRRRAVARERGVAPVTPDGDGPAVRLGDVV